MCPLLADQLPAPYLADARCVPSSMSYFRLGSKYSLHGMGLLVRYSLFVRTTTAPLTTPPNCSRRYMGLAHGAAMDSFQSLNWWWVRQRRESTKRASVLPQLQPGSAENNSPQLRAEQTRWGLLTGSDMRVHFVMDSDCKRWPSA